MMILHVKNFMIFGALSCVFILSPQTQLLHCYTLLLTHRSGQLAGWVGGRLVLGLGSLGGEVGLRGEGEVGAEAEAGAGREEDDLPGAGVHPPAQHRAARRHAGVLRLGGEHLHHTR